MWNSTGSALLVYAHSDTDASSYYGATGLFLLQAHTDNAIKVLYAMFRLYFILYMRCTVHCSML